MAKSTLTKSEAKELRGRCISDLFFLAKDILGYSRLTKATHQPLCDFFPKLDPTKSIDKQDVVKDRMLLYPRSAFKSTISMASAVQWILAFPNISIQVLTATSDLAVAFVDEIKSHFVLKEGVRRTRLQELFPEHCVADTVHSKGAGRGKSGQFMTPARTKYSKEPTVYASAIGKSNSGWHPFLQVLDDILDEQNTDNEKQLNKLADKMAMAHNLVKAGGYRQILGTRYAVNDAYGRLLKHYGLPTYDDAVVRNEFRYLCRPAWWLKGQRYKLPDENESLHPELIEVLFPEEQGYAVLRAKQAKNPQNFASQQLNDPVGASAALFLREDCLAATVPHTDFPTHGRVYVAWDLAYSTKQGRDYTVGAVGLVDDQHRLWILDIIRGRFTPYEMPHRIVRAMKEWSPIETAIEDTKGTKYMVTDLDRIAQAAGVPLRVTFFPCSQGANAKDGRIKSLQPLLKSKRLFFSSQIPMIENLYEELEGYGAGARHDDIPDAISFLLRYVPKLSSLRPTEKQAEEWEDLRQKYLHDLLFQTGAYAPPPPVAVEEKLPNAFTELGTIMPGLE